MTELLFVGAIWIVPVLLLWMAWRRYGTVHAATGTNRSLAYASLALLSLSSVIWLVFYGLVLISEYNKTVASIMNLGANPHTLAVVNILACAISFVLSLFMPKTVPGNVALQRAIMFAAGYLFLLWMFALTAH